MEEKLWIDEQTAQLILDAIAWCNRDWMDTFDWVGDDDETTMARVDFVRFCRARGIGGVEKKVAIG